MRACSCPAVISTCFSSSPMSRSSNGSPLTREPHLAIAAAGLHPARQVDPALPAPRGDQGVDPVHVPGAERPVRAAQDRKSTRLNSSHSQISYAVFCLKKKKTHDNADIHYPLNTRDPFTLIPYI